LVRPAEVRFYFDADLLGLAKVLARRRPGVTYPGDPGAVINKRQRSPCPVRSPATKLFMTQWRAIEGLTHESGPFIYIAPRTAPLRAIDLN
jgi:hypothetical protein